MASFQVGGTIEDVVNNILGVALGGKGQNASIDPNVRPSTVEQSSASPWLYRTHQQDHFTAGWTPRASDGKMTFWRKMKGTHVEWVDVELASGADVPKSSLSSDDVNSNSDILSTIRDAWEGFVRDVPGAVGPGKVLDAQSVADASTLFNAVSQYFDATYQEIFQQLAGVDQTASSFRGSASEAYVQRVQTALVKIGNTSTQVKAYTKALDAAAGTAQTFVKNLGDELGQLVGAYGGWMLNPSNFVIHMLKGAAMWTTDGLAPITMDSSGTATASSGSISTIHTHTPTIMLEFPDVSAGPWDLFVPQSWIDIDFQIRKLWAARMKSAFPNTIQSAGQLATDFETAANVLNPPKIADNPVILPPKSDNPLDGVAASLNGLGTNLDDGLNNLGAGFDGLGSGLNDGLNQFGDGIDGLGNSLNDGLSQFGNGLDGLGSGGGGSLSDPTQMGLHTLDPSVPGADGLGGSGADGLGDPTQMGLHSVDPNDPGLSSGVLSPGQSLDGTGQSLGDLSPQQLSALQQSGALNDVPLTAQQQAALDQAGTPAAAGATLGDLTPAQLGTLQKDGLLSNTPVTPADQQALDQAGLGTGASGLDSLGATAPSTKFPTSIDSVPISGAGGAGLGGGKLLGDVSKPLSHSLAGGSMGMSTGGIGATKLGAGLGGGSKIPAFGGSGLNGTSGGVPGSSSAGDSALNSVTDQSSAGGMPFMPPMGGMGGGGQPGGSQARERGTWLTEDEDVWGTDPDCAPAVIGRSDDFEEAESIDDPGLPLFAGSNAQVKKKQKGFR